MSFFTLSSRKPQYSGYVLRLILQGVKCPKYSYILLYLGDSPIYSYIWKTVLYIPIFQGKQEMLNSYYTPRKLCLWWGILFSRCPCVRPCMRVCVCPSIVTFYFFNNLESHCWIFIKPCKHVHICKTNTFAQKVRARGQFY